jgi:ParB family chromosome partitioning protein
VSDRRAYGAGLTKARTTQPHHDLAGVLQISEEGVGQLVAAKLIAIERIRANPNQPRQSFVDATLAELADSIRSRGVLQPIRVRREGDGFQIVAGERRFRAAQMAGLGELPAVVVEQNEDQAYVDSLIENIQREDLNPIDRAEALKQLRVNLGLHSWEAVGKAIGLTRQSIYNLLNLTDLPTPIQEDLRSGGLTEKHGRALRRLNREPDRQTEAYKAIVEEAMTGDQALALVRSLSAGSSPPSAPSAIEQAVRALDDRVRDLETLLNESVGRDERRAAANALAQLERRLSAVRSRLAD